MSVRGNLVGKGVVVEVEDQGLGIEFAERERLNAALRDPPDFQAMALSGQRHLGLFVVGQLAQRHGITVSLLESAYGGIKAIVLIPSSVVARRSGRRLAGAQPGRTARAAAACRGRDGPGRCPAAPRGGADSAGGRRSLPGNRSRLLRPGRSRGSPRLARVTEAAPRPGTGRCRARPGRAGRRCLAANGWRTSPGTTARRRDRGQHASRPPSRSAEEAHGSMSAFQRGTRLGRDSSGQDNR